MISLGRNILVFVCMAHLISCAKGTGRAPIDDRNVFPDLNKGYSNLADDDELKGESRGITNQNNTIDWRPKWYVIKGGDTLTGIALDHGLTYRELALWNNIKNPDKIEVGKKLKLFGQKKSDNSLGKQRTKSRSDVDLPADSEKSDKQLLSKKGDRSIYINWIWPVQGKVSYKFGEGKIKKGIAILGPSGQPVVASAPGVVVYSGSGLKGYGNMVIIKHNDTYLSVYAHNRIVLVKEGQAVAQGQKISEIGRLNSAEFGLHFEIRKMGKPINPNGYLPSSF